MTKMEMLTEMFAKGYTSQYSIEWFAQSFTEKQIKRFYESFMNHLNGVA